MTKIDIVSGFLGAGKTTLIKKLVSEAIKNEKVVLIENEFGEVGNEPVDTPLHPTKLTKHKIESKFFFIYFPSFKFTL